MDNAQENGGTHRAGSSIELVAYRDPREFQEACLTWLLQSEDINNGLIAMINLIAAGSNVYRKPFFLAILVENENIVGCCAHALPDGLFLSNMRQEAAATLVENFDPDVGVPRRIMGPPDVADLVASKWEKGGHVRKVLQTVWNVWRIDDVPNRPQPATGKLRLGTSSDQDIVASWGKRYGQEKPHAPVDVRDFLLRKLDRNELFIWDDTGPSSLAVLSGASDNGVRISAVYTPPEKRGAGHAANAVARLVEQEIGAGRKFLTLATEDGEQHVEAMYENLGFRKIGKRHCYLLESLVRELF